MKVSAILEVNGKEIKLEIPEEEIKKLIEASEQPQKTGYEGVEDGETYYYFNGFDVHTMWEDYEEGDGQLYNNANYYSDKTVAENNARADALMRKLRRFAVEHREKDINWNDDNQPKYEIYYYHKDQTIKISPYQNYQDFGTIYFDTPETAKAAVEKFKDELFWYFTEYKDSL